VGRSGAVSAGVGASLGMKGLRWKEGKQEAWGERRGGWPVGRGRGRAAWK